MTRYLRATALSMLATMALSAGALAQTLVVPKGTDVVLVFDQALDSKTAKEGQIVPLHVRDDVTVNGSTILSAGTKVTGVIANVRHRKRYGVNAKLRIALNPVQSTLGTMLPLEARSQGKDLHGKKSDQAAAATAGGAAVLGPVGLVGGFFIHGKSVQINPGDVFQTDVSKQVVLRR